MYNKKYSHFLGKSFSKKSLKRLKRYTFLGFFLKRRFLLNRSDIILKYNPMALNIIVLNLFLMFRERLPFFAKNIFLVRDVSFFFSRENLIVYKEKQLKRLNSINFYLQYNKLYVYKDFKELGNYFNFGSIIFSKVIFDRWFYLYRFLNKIVFATYFSF